MIKQKDWKRLFMTGGISNAIFSSFFFNLRSQGLYAYAYLYICSLVCIRRSMKPEVWCVHSNILLYRSPCWFASFEGSDRLADLPKILRFLYTLCRWKICIYFAPIGAWEIWINKSEYKCIILILTYYYGFFNCSFKIAVLFTKVKKVDKLW